MDCSHSSDSCAQIQEVRICFLHGRASSPQFAPLLPKTTSQEHERRRTIVPSMRWPAATLSPRYACCVGERINGPARGDFSSAPQRQPRKASGRHGAPSAGHPSAARSAPLRQHHTWDTERKAPALSSNLRFSFRQSAIGTCIKLFCSGHPVMVDKKSRSARL
jgi:hypothetical protein